MIAMLKSPKPGEFFDDQTSRYHRAEQEIGALCRAFELNRERLQPVFATKPTGRACWLPIDPQELVSMDVMEVYWRLGENYADERWVDGALEERFQSGSLVTALERVLGELNAFVPSAR